MYNQEHRAQLQTSNLKFKMKRLIILLTIFFYRGFFLCAVVRKNFERYTWHCFLYLPEKFRKRCPATLDTIKRMGITNIEFSNLFKRTASEIKQMLDERGMRCTSFGVSYSDLVEKTAEVARKC